MTVAGPTLVKCGDCGKELNESSNLALEERKPCPNCNSKKRAMSISISETVQVHEMIGLKAKHGSGGRPFMEQKVGDDLHRKSGKWVKLERVIDRAKNWYKEIILDPITGKIIHKQEEPLSKHRGHGSAKKP